MQDLMLLLYEPAPSDAAELQHILTRYADSYHGYLEAAEAVDTPNLAEAFEAIAHRRQEVVKKISDLIRAEGAKPDCDGSPEGTIHRWWLQLRAGMSNEEFHAVLDECVRGEKELARTLRETLAHGDLKTQHEPFVRNVEEELNLTISTFENALQT